MNSEFVINKRDFQTLPVVCDYMVSLLPRYFKTVLEPTPGAGNLVQALKAMDLDVHFPWGNFWTMEHKIEKYDAVVMNPPFTPMALGIKFLKSATTYADFIVCLFPTLALANRQDFQIELHKWGFLKIITLPRKAFKDCRIQCSIIVLQKGFTGPTTFEYFKF